MSGNPDEDPYRHLFRDEPLPYDTAGEPVGQVAVGEQANEPVIASTSIDAAVADPARAEVEAEHIEIAAAWSEPEPSEPEQPEPEQVRSAGDATGHESAAAENADSGPAPRDSAPEGSAPEYGDAEAAPPGPGPAQPTTDPAPHAASPVAPPAAPERSQAETGRLFRSTGADPATGALPALRGDQRRKLRTVGQQVRRTTAAYATGAGADGDVIDAEPHSPYEPLHATTASKAQARERLAERGGRERKVKGDKRVKPDKRTKRAEGGPLAAAVPSGPGLRAIGVFVVVIAVTLLLGLVDVLIGPGLGPIFGVGLLGSSAYAAFAVRRDDAIYAVTAPPIAAFLAVITVGQLNAGASVDSLSGRVIVAFFALADNWLWIIGSTLLALVIVLVRGVLAKRHA